MELTREKPLTWESIGNVIRSEKKQREAAAKADLFTLIQEGKRQDALESILFFSDPQSVPSIVGELFQKIEAEFDQAGDALQAEYLAFLVELALALGSLMPRWNLLDRTWHEHTPLTTEQVEDIAVQANKLAIILGAKAPEVEEKLLAELEAYARKRYTAEQASEPTTSARALVGGSIREYLQNARREIADSQLRRIAEMRFDGKTTTELSNDYAAFLQHTLYLGASFATTNPPLVNMAWDVLPDVWDPVVDQLIRDHPELEPPELAKRVTLEVVLAQMRLLRPIFLITEGRMGCVCFQVNPHNHNDAEAMVSDALSFYEQLRSRLDSDIPNVVFKLPGTQAGLEACRTLTESGIGVTITVDFGMFQHIPFAEAIQQGKAIFSCLVEMNGRLAFPVRDELLANLNQLTSFGIDEAKAREAAAWAGVLVAKRLYRLLKEKKIEQNRAKILIASLRIYRGEGYEELPNAFPDISEITGAAILSVFPNVRHAYDGEAEIDINPMQIESQPPAHVLDTLAHSEIFKQAYYVANRDWVAREDERFKPDKEITLADEGSTFAWPPVHNTLVEFMKSYDSTIERLAARKQELLDRGAD